MQEPYEEDMIRIKRENEKITYYSPSTKTHITEWEGEPTHPIPLEAEANYVIKSTGGNDRIISMYSQVFAILFFILSFFMAFAVPVFEFSGNKWLAALAMIGMLICLFLAFNLPATFEYHQDRKCRKCGKYLACEEYKRPEIKEISTPYEYTITETRYYKCKFCGHETTRRYKLYPTRKRKIRNSKILCEKCRKCQGKEYKSPDIMQKNDTIITKRYYKCENCGYKGIKKETKEIVSYSAEYV